MTFPRANPLGWALFELLTSDQMNVIDENMVFALDGRDGGTYSPSNAISLLGLNASGALLTIENPDGGVALQIDVTEGVQPQNGLTVQGSVEGTYVHFIGMNSVARAGESASVFEVIGHGNSLGNVGPAAHFQGGSASGPALAGGVAVRAFGGVKAAGAGRYGGQGFTGTSGDTNLTGEPSGSFGTEAMRGSGGFTTGTAAGHFGAVGVVGLGGELTGTGKQGGSGIFGVGGYGIAADPLDPDVGIGVRGVGGVGVHGLATLGLIDASLTSEFEASPIAGVRASSQALGQSILAEHSGGSVTSQAFNVFRWVGDATSVSSRSVAMIHGAPTTSPGGSLTNYGLTVYSEITAGNFVGMSVSGRGAEAAQFLSLGGLADTYAPIQLLGQIDGPTALTSGGLCVYNRKPSIGLLEHSLMYGHGPNANLYDRVVTSGDQAATWAWARIFCDGSPLGQFVMSSYNVDTAIAVGGTDLRVYLTNNLAGGNPATFDDLCVNVSMGYIGGGVVYVAYADMIGPDEISIHVMDGSGALVSFDANDMYIHISVYAGSSSWGVPADRPTFYRP